MGRHFPVIPLGARRAGRGAELARPLPHGLVR
jgi:hypothetical protein